ncbi:hypothetical protein [Polyangium spumosum]|uniref:Uncharacterized protein n=1 Tax=Polyangium spumosum TaxID=889282 RepID=A0A6N7PHY9_9BACT|nr:hypothetical protein [Polyangium spumosum]MRG91732.1 hypothetical protein [Polyangium spumosum]
MQRPNRNTIPSKCLDLAGYSERMLGKFSPSIVLMALAAKMKAGAAALAASQQAYEQAVRDILPARVDVKYENFVSDRRVRLTQQKAEIADGRRGGPIATLLFPEGSAPITKLVGASQVKAMVDLEGRLDVAEASWPEAQAEKAEIEERRKQYEAALESRQLAAQKARNLRVARDAAKEAFLTMYVEVMSRVAAEFPRDKPTQDLFFDEVRTRSALATADASDGDEAESDESLESSTTTA